MKNRFVIVVTQRNAAPFIGDDYILESLENIVILKPEGDFDLKEIVYMNKPVYLNLKR